jgi:hypothetical protein
VKEHILRAFYHGTSGGNGYRHRSSVGVIDQVDKDLRYLSQVWKSSWQLGVEAKRVLNLCEDVERLLKQVQKSWRILSALDQVRSRLDDVAKIPAKYTGETQRERVFFLGMVRCRMDDLKVTEHQMGVILQLLAARDEPEMNALLEDCRSSLTPSDQTTNTGIEITQGDQWTNSFSSVPPLPPFVETRVFTTSDMRC